MCPYEVFGHTPDVVRGSSEWCGGTSEHEAAALVTESCVTASPHPAAKRRGDPAGAETPGDCAHPATVPRPERRQDRPPVTDNVDSRC